MHPPSIIVKRARGQSLKKKDNISPLVDSELLDGLAIIRVPPMLYRKGVGTFKPLSAAYTLRCFSPAAVRYFHKRLAELMLELDGTVVIEDPPGTSGAA